MDQTARPVPASRGEMILDVCEAALGYVGRGVRAVLSPVESFCVLGHGHRIRENWERGHLRDAQLLGASHTYQKISAAWVLAAFTGIAAGAPLTVGGLGVTFALLATRDRRALRPATEIVTTQEYVFEAEKVKRAADEAVRVLTLKGERIPVLQYFAQNEACFEMRAAYGAFLKACRTYNARSPLDRVLRVHPTEGGVPGHITASADHVRQTLEGLICR